MARFYSNENFPLTTIVKLRDLGHDVVTALEAGNQRITDNAALAYAIAENRAILTINRKHFIVLHRRVRQWMRTSLGKQLVLMRRPRST